MSGLITDSALKERLEVARMIAMQRSPYWATEIAGLVWVQASKAVVDAFKRQGVDFTMAVTAEWVAIANPAIVTMWTADETATVVTHELMHLWQMHERRAALLGVGPEDAMTWNVACFPAGTLLPGGVPIEDVADTTTPYDGELAVLETQIGTLEPTLEHPVLVRARRHKVGVTPVVLEEPVWTPASEVRKGDYLLVPSLARYGLRGDRSIDLAPFVQQGFDRLGRPLGNRAVKAIPLDEGTAWLVGLYVAEGSASPNVKFSLAADEGYLADKIAMVATRLGWSASRCVNGSSMAVTLGTTVLGRWLKAHVGACAREKHVPDVIMRHEDAGVRRAFLAGLVDGDGCRQERDGKRWFSVGVASEALARDLVLLLAQDGLGAHVSRRALRPRQIGATWTDVETVLWNVSWNPDGASLSTRVMNGHEVTTRNARWRVDELGVWYPVKRAGRRPYSGFVYNLVETPDHTYVAGSLLVHNCDLEINDDLDAAKWPFPKTHPGVRPTDYGWKDGGLAEEYFEKLIALPRDKQPTAHGGIKGMTGGHNPKQAAAGQGSCGSASGVPSPAEAMMDLPKPERDEAELEDTRAGMAMAIEEYAAKNPGKVPAGLVLDARRMRKKSAVDWKAQIRSVVRTAISAWQQGEGVANWARFSRRSIGDVPRPTYRQPLPLVAVVRDTSGSMGGLLDRMYPEIEAVLQAARAEIILLDVDCQAYDVRRVRSIAEAERYKMQGGGGTSFVPAFDKLLSEPKAKRPGVIIYITDGYGDAPASQPPGVKVVWAMLGGTQAPAKWGSVVHVEATAA